MRYVVRLLAAILGALTGLQPAHAEKRVALVIGNAGYRAVAALPNPRKDARDVAAALRAAQFAEVVEGYDLGVREMQRALSQFEDKATGADWAVVYYAGHGIEVDGRNYLVPVDAQLKRATDVEDEALSLDRVLARVATARKLQLVILDACRENPFRRRMAGVATRTVGERGLARIEPAHPNVIVAYAARDGHVALDGRPGDNSPYARALLKYLAEPGLELGKFFRKVRDDVLADTGGRQRPFEYGSLTGQDLFFRPGAVADVQPLRRPAPLTVAEERALRPGDRFRECDVCPEMVVVPAGSFTMGSPETEESRDASEGPQRRVTVARPFAVGRFEVTFAEWDACVAAGGCVHSPDDQAWGRGDRPVIDVSWNDVVKTYLPWLSARTGKTYRLLTEAEWEYAARGAASASMPGKRYWWGDEASRAHANYGTDKCCGGHTEGGDRWKFTAPVGQFPANPFGLHDMHGNVYEWVEDCWHENYAGAPTDGSAWTASCSEPARVFRGGAWGDGPLVLRSAYRLRNRADHRNDDLGFRLARTL
jgi:formylglycine-generating enzyme required for sulfatase activity